MADKKITELPELSGRAQITDIFLAVRGGVDYQLDGEQLVNLISAVISFGSVITFAADTPDNSSGSNGDVVIKPASGQFLQKIAGTWQLKYTVPAAGSGNTVLYGVGAPNVLTGAVGDTYIDTVTGKFYKKNNTPAWPQVFSMASGPPGAPGSDGAPGADGSDGKTVLNGITPPSNDLGVNGDFYINTNTWFIYGPKAAGVWGVGTSLVGNSPSFKQAYNYLNTDARFVYDSVNMTLTFNLNTADKTLFPYDPDNGILNAVLREKYSATQYKQRNSFEPIITDDGDFYISVLFEGVTADLRDNTQIILS